MRKRHAALFGILTGLLIVFVLGYGRGPGIATAPSPVVEAETVDLATSTPGIAEADTAAETSTGTSQPAREPAPAVLGARDDVVGDAVMEVESQIIDDVTISVKEIQISYTTLSESDRSAQFTAVAVFENGETKDVTLESNWSVDPAGMGSMSATGVYQAGETAGDTVYVYYGDQTVSVPVEL